MREAELWQRLAEALGPAYCRVWAAEFVLADLGGRTVIDALAAGLPSKRIWRAVWEALELPPAQR